MIQNISRILFKSFRKFSRYLSKGIYFFRTKVAMYAQDIEHESFSTIGYPYISIAYGGKCRIGANFKMNNTLYGNPIGRPQRCVVFVDKGASLTIGKNVGISQTAVICHYKITIGDYVKIGGGVCIYDTDFHSLNPQHRRDPQLDMQHKARAAVSIGNNVFIGSHTTILKGVTIGDNSIIGACSVVTKDVPTNEIWAGNPARFIRMAGIS